MAKRAEPVRKASVPQVLPPTPTPDRTINISVESPAEANQALSLRDQATALAVIDKPSHQAALEFLRGAKSLKRVILDQ
jgi:hypothetical protein